MGALDSATAGPDTAENGATRKAAPPKEVPTTAGVGARGNAPLRGALAWSYIWTTGGTLVAGLLQIGVTAILDPSSVGVMVLAMVWVTLALSLLQHGPSLAIVQQDNISEEHVNAGFWVTMLGSVGYTAVFAAAVPLWAAVNHLPQLVPVCLALTPVILLAAFCTVMDAVMRRRMQVRSLALRSLTSALVSGLVGLGCAVAGLGVWALVIQQLVAYALYPITQWFVTPWKPRWPKPRATLQAWRDIRRTSVQTLAGSVGYFASSKIDGLLMGMFFTPAAVGLYRFAGRFAEMVVDLTSRGVEQVSLPELARHNAEPEQLAARLGRLLHVAVVLAFPSLAILATVAQPFVLLLGEQWAPAAAPLRVLCAVSAVGVIGNLLTPALQAAQRPGVPTAFTWLSAATYALGFLAAVQITSSDGTIGQLTAVATAVLGLRILLTALMVYVAYRRILRVPVRPTVVAATPALLAALAALLAGWLVQDTVGAELAPLPALLVYGSSAAVAAGIVLLCLDGQARRWGRGALRVMARTAG